MLMLLDLTQSEETIDIECLLAQKFKIQATMMRSFRKKKKQELCCTEQKEKKGSSVFVNFKQRLSEAKNSGKRNILSMSKEVDCIDKLLILVYS
ncbi:hypothetical protein M0813_13789 [Anaeramoeba flamelloides]|uniref:Uncharacterized protein n=1 Tax=Anaeramoeba flamelloides TaxID=1746091 RepID=A0ABQ8Z804_9EUKA|nr:hypothetical protein M0813_13789 [Anaeramoeba flamelloides]